MTLHVGATKLGLSSLAWPVFWRQAALERGRNLKQDGFCQLSAKPSEYWKQKAFSWQNF